MSGHTLRDAFKPETRNEIRITVNPNYSEARNTHPLSVYVRREGDRGREAGGVEVRNMNMAMTYANGVNHGLAIAGLPQLAIMTDMRLKLEE